MNHEEGRGGLGLSGIAARFGTLPAYAERGTALAAMETSGSGLDRIMRSGDGEGVSFGIVGSCAPLRPFAAFNIPREHRDWRRSQVKNLRIPWTLRENLVLKR